MKSHRKLSVVGLGYVGLPVAVSFGLSDEIVIAFDIDKARIEELRNGVDRTNEVESDELKEANLSFTTNPKDLDKADFHIVTVPTPVDDENKPDLTALRLVSATIGKILKKDDIVVFESTVYPGVTMNICGPILEQESGLRLNDDFSVGYSPERINPGDKQHRFDSVKKVVSASNEAALEIIADTYGKVVKAGIHKAPAIDVAEAAKVIENTQRDLNIALINELSVIFNRLEIDTQDVLAAAGTKWNFLPFTPGLVGGHCIGVDPYYLTHCAEQVGYVPEVILSGRRINNRMGEYVVENLCSRLLSEGREPGDCAVSVLGVTFKENVPDIRNSQMHGIIKDLMDRGFEVRIHDPIADGEEVYRDWGVKLKTREDLVVGDAVVLGVSHTLYVSEGWTFINALLKKEGGVVADVKACLPRAEKPDGVTLWRL